MYCLAGKIKSLAWGDYIYYTQITTLYSLLQKKKGDFDVVVAVFVMTVVVCSFEYLRLFLSVRPYEMSYRTVGDFLFCLSV